MLALILCCAMKGALQRKGHFYKNKKTCVALALKGGHEVRGFECRKYWDFHTFHKTLNGYLLDGFSANLHWPSGS